MNNHRNLLIVLGAASFTPQTLFAQAKRPPVVIGWPGAKLPDIILTQSSSASVAAANASQNIPLVQASGVSPADVGLAAVLASSAFRHASRIAGGDVPVLIHSSETPQ